MNRSGRAVLFTMSALTLAWPAASAASAISAACPAASGTAGDPTYPVRQAAFDAIARNEPGFARSLFHCAVDARSDDRVALAQLVYLDLDAGDKAGAIQDVEKLRSLHAATKDLEMQLGYLYDQEKNLVLARQAFERAIAYHDPAVTAKANAALAEIAKEWPRYQLVAALDSQYMARFNDEVTDASLHFDRRITWSSPVSAYANLRVLRDTASHAGLLPQIYSDNAALFGAGLIVRPRTAPYSFSAEANEAYVLSENASGQTHLVPDFRVVAGFYRNWQPAAGRLGGEGNGSVGYYSRYQHDGIAYFQPRQYIGFAQTRAIRVSAFEGENVALDSNRQFYNNIAEFIPGLELHAPTVSLRTEYVRGFYLALPGISGNPYGPQYTDIRIRLLFGQNFRPGGP